jgi:glutathione synthase/RimK-type ligase-like ATP-grasp enzyme
VILLCGIRSEPPLAMVAAELERIGAPFAWFDQRQALRTRLDVALADGRLTGRLRTPEADVELGSVRAAYIRAMDDRFLPEVESLAADAPARRRVRALHDRLYAWLAVTPAMVVNRSAAQASNAAKPYQLEIIAATGFAIPETLVTNDPAQVRAFRDQHRLVVYKSMSGERSIVSSLTDLDLERLDRLRLCPVQFQAWVPGPDVRVHVVGDETFAACVRTSAIDYRYPARSGELPPEITRFELSGEITQRCVALARRLGLELAGIDLRMAEHDGEPVCLEVNPSPAFSYYELAANLPIAAAVARHLANAPRPV